MKIKLLLTNESEVKNHLLRPRSNRYIVSVDLADTPSIPAMVMYENGKVVKVKTGFDII